MITQKFHKTRAKGQTKKIYSLDEIKKAGRILKAGFVMNLVIALPDDKWIRRPLIGGIITYIADMPFPWIYGEMALTAGATTAGLRYLFTRKTIKNDYEQGVLKEALHALNSKENSTPLSLPCGTPKYAPQPLV